MRFAVMVVLVGLICSGCIPAESVDPCDIISEIDIAQHKRDRGWPIGVQATIIEQNFGVPRSEMLACH